MRFGMGLTWVTDARLTHSAQGVQWPQQQANGPGNTKFMPVEEAQPVRVHDFVCGNVFFMYISFQTAAGS